MKVESYKILINNSNKCILLRKMSNQISIKLTSLYRRCIMGGKISLYISIAAIVFFIFTVIWMAGGPIAVLFSILIAFTLNLFRYHHNNFWIDILFTCFKVALIISVVHYFLRISYVTVLILCFFLSYYLVEYLVKSKKWSNILQVFVAVTIYIFLIIFGLFLNSK